MVLKANDLLPGQLISLDQYKSSIRGRTSMLKGKEPNYHKCWGSTIGVGHASGFVSMPINYLSQLQSLIVAAFLFILTMLDCVFHSMIVVVFLPNPYINILKASFHAFGKLLHFLVPILVQRLLVVLFS